MPVRLLFAILDNAIANGNSQPQSGRGNDGIRHFKSDDAIAWIAAAVLLYADLAIWVVRLLRQFGPTPPVGP